MTAMVLSSIYLALDVLSIAYVAWLMWKIYKLEKQLAERDDLIDDLRATLGGTEDKTDWRNFTL